VLNLAVHRCCRRIQEDILDIGCDRNGCGATVQRGRTDEEIRLLSDQRQTDRRSQGRTHLSHRDHL